MNTLRTALILGTTTAVALSPNAAPSSGYAFNPKSGPNHEQAFDGRLSAYPSSQNIGGLALRHGPVETGQMYVDTSVFNTQTNQDLNRFNGEGLFENVTYTDAAGKVVHAHVAINKPVQRIAKAEAGTRTEFKLVQTGDSSRWTRETPAIKWIPMVKGNKNNVIELKFDDEPRATTVHDPAQPVLP